MTDPVEPSAVPNPSTPPNPPKVVETPIHYQSPEAAKLGLVGKEAYDKMGRADRWKTKLKANWNVAGVDEAGNIIKVGGFGTALRVGGTMAGVVATGYGLKDAAQVLGVISPSVDEKGQEIPVDSSKIFKAAAELGGGILLVYNSLLRRGPTQFVPKGI